MTRDREADVVTGDGVAFFDARQIGSGELVGAVVAVVADLPAGTVLTLRSGRGAIAPADWSQLRGSAEIVAAFDDDDGTTVVLRVGDQAAVRRRKIGSSGVDSSGT